MGDGTFELGCGTPMSRPAEDPIEKR